MNIDTQFLDHVRKLVDDVEICMLTTMTATGKHVSRPMAVQEMDADGNIWFFIDERSDKAQQVAANADVNVAFSSDKKGVWVSVAGQAATVADRAKAEQLWNPLLKAWFPDGLETEGIALLKVDAISAEYWDSPSSKVATTISLAKAVATGKSAAGDLGDNESGAL